MQMIKKAHQMIIKNHPTTHKEFNMDKKVKTTPEVAPEVKEAEERALIDELVAKVSAAQKEFANFSHYCP